MWLALGQSSGRHASDLGASLFSFVVVADSHVNQEEDKASSDFAVNRLSNARNRHVIHEINRIAPAFVLHLGDMVHPTPTHPGYSTAAGAFHELAKELKCPLYLTPGNHDVGDKPGDWLPVPSVNEEFLALYERLFGTHFYSFDSNGCHFAVINAQIINSGLACEETQRNWLEQDLAANAGRRIFLCTHYPPYLHEPQEDGHYDNIDEPGRSWLLGLLTGCKVEAVFAGHVHNFWYHLHGETEIYLLPSTAFVRLDYSELYRVEPGPERGRNDAPKLGFLVVDVHEFGHVANPIRTFGATLAPRAKLDRSRRLPAVHTKSITRAPVGIDLRYPWAEAVEVAASGALDEFARKLARNDYPLMALWEMGVRRLRIPLRDLANPATRERMRVLKRAGHEFTVYTHAVPPGDLRDVLTDHCDLISVWEVIAARRNFGAVLSQVSTIKAAAPLTVHLSKLRRHDDVHHHGDRARHVIEHGFLPDEEEEIRELLQRNSAIDGFLFRLPREQSPWSGIQAIERVADALGTRGSAYVRLAADNPAQAMEDDLANANRVAETVVVAHACRNVDVWLDTFNDVDRGYFPRTGLVDRRYNPRIAGHVYRNLHGVLSAPSEELSLKETFAVSGARVLTMEKGAREVCFMIMPEREVEIGLLPWTDKIRQGPIEEAKWIDLASGEIATPTCSMVKSDGRRFLKVDHPVRCGAPALLNLSR